MNNNNWWGEPDDVEPLPAWMDPKTYRESPLKQIRQPSKSLTEAIEDAMKKPAVDVTYITRQNDV